MPGVGCLSQALDNFIEERKGPNLGRTASDIVSQPPTKQTDTSVESNASQGQSYNSTLLSLRLTRVMRLAEQTLSYFMELLEATPSPREKFTLMRDVLEVPSEHILQRFQALLDNLEGQEFPEHSMSEIVQELKEIAKTRGITFFYRTDNPTRNNDALDHVYEEVHLRTLVDKRAKGSPTKFELRTTGANHRGRYLRPTFPRLIARFIEYEQN